jgi:hypothetical protein
MRLGSELSSSNGAEGTLSTATNNHQHNEVSHSPNIKVGAFDVAVFWDYENVQIPVWCSGVKASDAIRSNVIPFGRIVDRKLYYDSSKLSDRTNFARSELDSSGFTLVDCPSRNSKETLDKKLIVDVLFFAWERASRGAKACVVLITSDGDYSYTLARLRDIGVFTVIIFRPDVVAKILIDNADVVMSWEYDVLGGNVEMPSSKGNQESSVSSCGSKDIQEINIVQTTTFGVFAVFLSCVLNGQQSRVVDRGGSVTETWGLEGRIADEFYTKSGALDRNRYQDMRRKALQRNFVEVGRRLLKDADRRVVQCDIEDRVGKSMETYLRLTQTGLDLIRPPSNRTNRDHPTVVGPTVVGVSSVN